MRKYRLISSVVVSASLLLAACGGNENGSPVGTVMPTGAAGEDGVLTTPGLDSGPGDVDGTAGDGLQGTPDPGYPAPALDVTPVVSTPDPAYPAPGAGTGSGATTGGSTTDGAAGGSTTGGVTAATPGVTAGGENGSVPRAGAEQQFVLLSNLLGMTVEGQDGQQAGSVQGVVIDRPAASGTTTGGAAPGDAAANGSATLGTVDSSGARVSYLLMDQALVPFQAFDVEGASESASGVTSSDARLTLTADAAQVQGAPAFDAQAFDGRVGDDVASYWSGQMAGIPATGPGASESILLRGQLGAVNVTDAQGNNLGQVRDLVLDAETGEILYAVLSGGSLFQGQSYIVPMSVVNWLPGSGQGQGQGNALGSFTLNAPGDVFSQAPSINSMDDLQTDPAWNDTVENYWNGQK